MNLKQRLQLEQKEFANLEGKYSFSRMKKNEIDIPVETEKVTDKKRDVSTDANEEV